jgi:hypothetical protein
MSYPNAITLLSKALREPGGLLPSLTAPQWNEILAIAEGERVLTLLWHDWHAAGLSKVLSATHYQYWQLKVYRIIAQIALLRRTNQSLLTALAQQTRQPAKVVLLKGAAFQFDHYAHADYRPLSDIDWWVAPSDIPVTRVFLEQQGYQQKPVQMSRNFNALLQHEIGLEDTRHQVCVELHWGLLSGSHDRACGDHNWFWQRTVPFAQSDIVNLAVHRLDPTANLLYLVAHYELQQHMGNDGEVEKGRLLWLYDMHQLLCHPSATQIDWVEVLQVSRQWHWVSIVRNVLARLQRTFESPMPATILPALDQAEGAADRQLYQRRGAPGHAARDYQWHWF